VPTTIDWLNRIIYPDRADMVQVQVTPVAVYQLNINDFRLQLTELLGDVFGMPNVDTHIYNPPVTVAGVTLARVMEIINSYTVTFLPDSAWAVDITGGNSNISDRTNPNNVSVRSANSAGLQDSESLQAASFGGVVALHPTNGVPGTTFPRGTRQTPVNNLADAATIARERGINTILVMESMTLTTETVDDGFRFLADNVNTTYVTLDPSVGIANAIFENMHITGTLDGNNVFQSCRMGNCDYLSGILRNCGLEGTLTLNGAGECDLINCFSAFAGAGPGQIATVDMGGSGATVLVRNYAGGIALTNYSGGGAVSIDMDSGRVVVGADVTAGDIYIRGIAAVTDGSTGTAVIHDDTLNRGINLAEKILRNRRETNPTTGKQRVYDDDSVTVLLEGDLFEDIAGTTPYQGSGADRADRLE